MADAVVIGAGHNGLVAANLLADEGWSVTVLEASDQPGGAVRSGQLTKAGYIHDLFSAFYPLAAASPVLQSLDLGAHGLRWRQAPLVLAHPLADGRTAVLSRDIDRTAASLDIFAPGDGDAWRELHAQYRRIESALLGALFTPFPPVIDGLKLAARLRYPGLVRFLRFTLLPARRMADERFRGEGAGLLLAGNGLHADLAPEYPGSGVFGWLLTMLGQIYGYPVPEGGAQSLTDALVRRLDERGGILRCGERVTRIHVRRGRAVAVSTAQGGEVAARRAVIADVGAPALYLDLVGPAHLPPGVVEDIQRFEYDYATFKVDWALDGPVPWESEEARQTGTVHIADSVDDLSETAAQIAQRRLPSNPFMIVGQMTTADPSRSPAGTESLWSYTHVPQRVRGDAGGDLTGSWEGKEGEVFAERLEERIERRAPGFRNRIVGRHVFTPPALQALNPNLVGGATNGGTAQIQQQLVFRPTPGLGRPGTPIRGLFLGSASAHPGGGVHGGPGSNAARAALQAHRRRRGLVAGAGGAALAGALARRG